MAAVSTGSPKISLHRSKDRFLGYRRMPFYLKEQRRDFLYLGFNAPNAPMHALIEDIDPGNTQVDTIRNVIGGTLKAMDRNIGR